MSPFTSKVKLGDGWFSPSRLPAPCSSTEPAELESVNGAPLNTVRLE